MSFLELVLYPFSVIYNLVTKFRNYLFDIQYKRSFKFQTNVISVGNLSVGGTGKTPMIEYLIRLLQANHNIATLSRGYGRKTRGFRLATENDDSRTLGDEPYQFYNKFKNITVTVGEQRALAIPFILAEKHETEVILLDDAYQHRYVDPNLNILLTDFNRPFFKDRLLPSGRLRESRTGAKRASVIVVTKCPSSVDSSNEKFFREEIAKYNSNAELFFSRISYQDPKPVYESEKWSDNVLLFSGIANNEKLKEYVKGQFNLVKTIEFGDHHHYQPADLNKITQEYNLLASEHKCILTTEKDMVKLIDKNIPDEFKQLPLFYLPIQFEFLNNGKRFDKIILNSITSYSN